MVSRIILSTGSRADSKPLRLCTLAGQYGLILMGPCNIADHGKLQIGESGLCFLGPVLLLDLGPEKGQSVTGLDRLPSFAIQVTKVMDQAAT